MPDFSVLTTHTGIMKAIAVGFLPKTIDDNNYSGLSPKEEQAKLRYRAFLQDVLRHVLRFVRIDVIVSGNFAYFAERELHARRGSGRRAFYRPAQGKSEKPRTLFLISRTYIAAAAVLFGGRRIIVYNATERDVQTAAGIVTRRPDHHLRHAPARSLP